MESIRIVKLQPSQWQKYKELRLEALLNDPQAFATSYEESVKKPDSHWQERLKVAQEEVENWMLFAQEGDRLVGMVGAYTKDGITWIVSVYVSKDFRGKGIAKKLLISIIDKLKQAGIHKITLGVNKNQLPAFNLYKSLGFIVIRQEKHLMADGKYHSEYIMEKELDS